MSTVDQYFILEFIFFVSAFLVLYSYAIYPLLLIFVSSAVQAKRDALLVLSGSERRVASSELPSVAVVISAYNEESCIRERVENLLSLDYPADLIHFYIGSDGSRDETGAILKTFSDARLRAFAFEENRGKSSVLNDLVSRADAEVLVFSDANTYFESNAIHKLVRHFADSNVGGVVGELDLVDAETGSNLDSVYWKYERLLKFHESRIGGLLGANGAIYAIRKSLFRPIPADTIVDDFSIALNVSLQRHLLVYDMEAKAKEEVAPSQADEFGRRVRIGTGNFQSLLRYKELFSPRKGVLCWTYLSHKVLRWLSPFFLLFALLSSALLSFGSVIYSVLFCLQIFFYGFAYRYRSDKPSGRLMGLVVFWILMNAALAVGAYRLATGRASGSWNSTKR